MRVLIIFYYLVKDFLFIRYIMNFLTSCDHLNPSSIVIDDLPKLDTYIKSSGCFEVKTLTYQEVEAVIPTFCSEHAHLREELSALVRSDDIKYVGLYKKKNNNGTLLVLCAYEITYGECHIHYLCKCKKMTEYDSKSCNISNLSSLLVYWVLFTAQNDNIQKAIVQPETDTGDLSRLKGFYEKLGFKNDGVQSMSMDLTQAISLPSDLRFETRGGATNAIKQYVIYNGHKYLVRISNKRKYILVKKQNVFFGDIRGKYKYTTT
jgi:DUF2075 family protein